MNFRELFNRYMQQLDCTAKELSERSGISASVISRYRSGEREPQPDSDTLATLASVLAAIASERDASQFEDGNDFTEDFILSTLRDALLSKTRTYAAFLQRFNLLYDKLHLNMKELSSFTNFDTSFLYRMKSGERKLSDIPSFCDKVARYLVTAFSDKESKEQVSSLLDITPDEIADSDSYYAVVFQWLTPDDTVTEHISASKEASNSVSQFLTKMDSFDLEDFICVIHFDKLKVPTLPLHLPSTKNYYGIEKMREGELDFFKLTVTSKTREHIFMCSDMPMLDLAKSNDFNKKWMFAIACAIKKGLHLDMVHSLNRPWDELMLGLEAWIPIYMTGQVSPYYLPKQVTSVYHHLNYVSGVAALCGESIEGAPLDGKYTLTNNKEELAYFQRKAKHLLSHAKPLMEIYDSSRSGEYQVFLRKDANTKGKRQNLLSAPPIYTMSEALLEEILNTNQVTASDAKILRNYWRSEVNRMEQKLENSVITDKIALPLESDYQNHPMHMSVSGCFFHTPMAYTYPQAMRHWEETQAYAKKHEAYDVQINEQSAFTNIQIEVMENQYVMISKLQSPAIHFVIRHPKLVHALQNFTVPVVE